MTVKQEIKVFLASSRELELERVYTGDLINDINTVLANIDADVRIKLLKWESFNPSFTGKRKQGEYDEQVKKADIFIVLFCSIAGDYTLEEVETAIIAQKQYGKPKELVCYIKNYQGERKEVNDQKEKLSSVFKIDIYSDIESYKLKTLQIFIPYLKNSGVNIAETDKFISIDNKNIFRKADVIHQKIQKN